MIFNDEWHAFSNAIHNNLTDEEKEFKRLRSLSYLRKSYPPGSKDLTDSEKEKVHGIAKLFKKQKHQNFYPNHYLKKWANKNKAGLNEDMFTYLLYSIGSKEGWKKYMKACQV